MLPCSGGPLAPLLGRAPSSTTPAGSYCHYLERRAGSWGCRGAPRPGLLAATIELAQGLEPLSGSRSCCAPRPLQGGTRRQRPKTSRPPRGCLAGGGTPCMWSTPGKRPERGFGIRLGVQSDCLVWNKSGRQGDPGATPGGRPWLWRRVGRLVRAGLLGL